MGGWCTGELRTDSAASASTVVGVADGESREQGPGGWLGPVVALLLVLAVGASLVSGIPESLPGVALGSSVTLHAERAAVFFVGLLLALVVLVRAFQGRLPSELSGRGVKYADRQGTEQIRDTTATALEQLEAAHRHLMARVEALEEHPGHEADALQGEPG